MDENLAKLFVEIRLRHVQRDLQRAAALQHPLPARYKDAQDQTACTGHRRRLPALRAGVPSQHDDYRRGRCHQRHQSISGTLPVSTLVGLRAICSDSVSYLFFNDSCQTNYLKMYLTDLRQIFGFGTTKV